MSTLQETPRPTAANAPLARRDAGRDAFTMLRIAFAVAPIAFGLDKFFNVLTDWPQYLAGWVDDLMPGSAQDFMYAVGAIEIVAGILVAVRPRYGAPLVAACLGAAGGRRRGPCSGGWGGGFLLPAPVRSGVLRRRAARLRADARRAH